MVPDIRQEDIDAVISVLRSGMLIQGTKVDELENNIARYLGVKHAIAVSNGTASLHMALVALGIGKGDEVIVPAFSYIATANVVELVGAKPVFVDIDITTFNIDINKIEAAISAKTKAIIPVHEFGLACDIDAVCEIAKKYRLLVIEDAACALGATDHGRFAGTFGLVGSFSFHPRKAITSGEGGMLVTNDEAIAKRLRILRNHGIEMQNGKMEFVEVGFNYRLTDFQAALVNSQFKRMEANLECKDMLAKIYLENLNNCKYLQLPSNPENKRHTWQTFHAILNEDLKQERIIELLKERGIGTNYGAQCIPFQKYFKNKYKLQADLLFPNSMKAYTKGLALPLYEKLGIMDIRRIANEVNKLK